MNGKIVPLPYFVLALGQYLYSRLADLEKDSSQAPGIELRSDEECDLSCFHEGENIFWKKFENLILFFV